MQIPNQLVLLTQRDIREEEELENLQVMGVCDSIEVWLSFDLICICGILIVLRITLSLFGCCEYDYPHF